MNISLYQNNFLWYLQSHDHDLPPSYEDVTAKPPPYSILFLKAAATAYDNQSSDGYVVVPFVPLTPKLLNLSHNKTVV